MGSHNLLLICTVQCSEQCWNLKIFLFAVLALAYQAGWDASPLSPEALGFDVSLSAPKGLRSLKIYYYMVTFPGPPVTCHMALFYLQESFTGLTGGGTGAQAGV